MQDRGSIEIKWDERHRHYRLILNGQDISHVIASDGIRIEWEGGVDHPRVYLKLGYVDLHAVLPKAAVAVVESLPRVEVGTDG